MFLGRGRSTRRVKPVIDEIECRDPRARWSPDAVLSMGLSGEEPTNLANKNIWKKNGLESFLVLEGDASGPLLRIRTDLRNAHRRALFAEETADNVIGLTVFEEEAIEAHEQVLGDKTSISHPRSARGQFDPLFLGLSLSRRRFSR